MLPFANDEFYTHRRTLTYANKFARAHSCTHTSAHTHMHTHRGGVWLCGKKFVSQLNGTGFSPIVRYLGQVTSTKALWTDLVDKNQKLKGVSLLLVLHEQLLVTGLSRQKNVCGCITLSQHYMVTVREYHQYTNCRSFPIPCKSMLGHREILPCLEAAKC